MAVTSYSAYVRTGLSVEIVHCILHIRFFSLCLGLLAVWIFSFPIMYCYLEISKDTTLLKLLILFWIVELQLRR